ncbi:MAG: hypothetical protein FJ034_02840 [Chloroflexi bacterium]|nr:hypothetical protein [Chloroflexota bacterium]
MDLRPGMRVRYRPAEFPDQWREGTLVQRSANGEEWLVRTEFGRYWIGWRRITALEEPVY